MERTHKTRHTTEREQQVEEAEHVQADTDRDATLDGIDELLDDIDEVLEDASTTEIDTIMEIGRLEETLTELRLEQRTEDAQALHALGLYAPLDLGDFCKQTLDPTCAICGRCPVLPNCAEAGC